MRGSLLSPEQGIKFLLAFKGKEFVTPTHMRVSDPDLRHCALACFFAKFGAQLGLAVNSMLNKLNPFLG
jgi:hypothetical protein